MKLECSATNWTAAKSCDEQQRHGISSLLWVGGDAEPGIKTAFKAPVELSKILVEAPSGIGGGRVFDCKAHHGCLEESFNLPHCRHEPVALTGRKRAENAQRQLVGSPVKLL